MVNKNINVGELGRELGHDDDDDDD